MLTCYPDDFQAWLFGALQLQPGDETSPDILEPLFRLNHTWIEGDAIPDYASQPSLMRAYACFYMTINMPKLWAVLDQSKALLARLLAADTIRVTEFGCGPGTFLFAFLFYLKQRCPAALKRPIVCCGLDQSEAALGIARRLANGLRKRAEFKHCRFEFECGDWRDACARPDDLVIFGNVLNEGHAGVPAIGARNLIAIEPGTRAVFHNALLPFRNALLADGWRILFPCTSAHACPMATDNWCHFHVNRLQLPFIQRICNQARRLNARHHYCGLSFVRDDVDLPVCRWRVLSRLRRQSRSGIRWLCDGEHMIETLLNRKARQEHNRLFLDAAAGDAVCIRFTQPVAAFLKTGRLLATDMVEPEDPS